MQMSNESDGAQEEVMHQPKLQKSDMDGWMVG